MSAEGVAVDVADPCMPSPRWLTRRKIKVSPTGCGSDDVTPVTCLTLDSQFLHSAALSSASDGRTPREEAAMTTISRSARTLPRHCRGQNGDRDLASRLVPAGPALGAFVGELRTLLDVTDHMRTVHGRSVLDLPEDRDTHDAIHRFEHFEAGLGLVLVDHLH